MAESYSFGNWRSSSEDILKDQFPLHRACRDGDVQTLSVILVEAQHGIYAEDSFYGWTPAHWAAYFGKLNCLMQLQAHEHNCDYSTLRLCQTASHVAAMGSQAFCLKWLLQCGAKIDRQLACLRNLMQNTRVGVDCNIQSSRFNQMPVHLASFAGHPQCLLWLLQSGAQVDGQDYLGETPTHKAARCGSMECASLLVSHGARLFIRNNNGMTPPELAASCGFTECAKYLQAASSRQDTLPRGVYDSRPASSNAQVIQETPKDVSAAVINAGLNGGKLPCPSLPATTIPNGLAADTHHDNECEMDDDCDDDAQGVPARNGHGIQSLSEVHSHQAHHAVNGCHLNGNDITIHQGISANLTMVTGKKRSWEDADDLVDPKRVRTVESLSSTTEVSFPVNWGNLVTKEPYQQVLELPVRPMNPVFPFSYMANEAHCGEDAAAHGLRLTVQLEYPSAATATDAFSKHLVTAPQPCSTPGPEPFGRPTPVAGHQVQDFCAQNGWLAQKDGASRGAWGGMEDAVALDEGLLTSSAHEHKQCMTVQQGYDSMFCDAVISHFHGI